MPKKNSVPYSYRTEGARKKTEKEMKGKKEGKVERKVTCKMCHVVCPMSINAQPHQVTYVRIRTLIGKEIPELECTKEIRFRKLTTLKSSTYNSMSLDNPNSTYSPVYNDDLQPYTTVRFQPLLLKKNQQ